MEYQKRNFVKEQLLTAEDLNAMDAQIAKNEEAASEAKTTANNAKSAADAAYENANTALDKSTEALNAIATAFVDRGELTSENNVDDVKEPGVYRWYADDAPSGSPISGDGMMVVFRSGTQNLITQTVTSLYPSEKTKKRTMYPSGWSEWSEPPEDDSELMTYRRTLAASDDMDTLTQIGVYFYNGDDAPSNAPFEAGGVSVMVYGDDTTELGIVTQIATSRYADATYIKIRVGGSGAWSSWFAIDENSGYFAYRELLKSDDDLNLIVTPGIYYLGISEGYVPANSPFQPGETTSPVLFVYGSDGSGNATNEIVQIATGFGAANAKMKFRTGGASSTNWTPWMSVMTGEIVQETGDSETDVMSQKAVTEAIGNMSGGNSGVSEQFGMLMRSMYTTGVMTFDYETRSAMAEPDSLGCKQGADGLSVVIQPGGACIDGMFFWLNEEKTLTFATQDSANIVNILIRADRSAGTIGMVVLENCSGIVVPQSYELGIAILSIPAGATQASEIEVNDTRFGYATYNHGTIFTQEVSAYLGLPGEKRHQMEQEIMLSSLYTNGIIDDRLDKDLMEELGEHDYVLAEASRRKEPFAITQELTSSGMQVRIAPGKMMINGRVYSFYAQSKSFSNVNLTGAEENTIIGFGYNTVTNKLYWLAETVDMVYGNMIAIKTDPETGEDIWYPRASIDGDDVYEVIMAVVKVPEGATAYTTDMVTDVRKGPMCGYSKHIIQNMYGTQERPTYNGNDLALIADLDDMQTQINTANTNIDKKVSDMTIELYNGTTGNPKPVKFATVNYSTCNSEAGVAIKISMVSGHGNGISYAFLQDAIIRVNHSGSVEVDNFKFYGADAGTYDGAARQYGDIFWVIDTTNKIVDFYCLMGQYARVYQSPFKRLTYSTGGTVTQHTSCTVYSSGDKVYGNNSDIALMSDIPKTTETLNITYKDGTTGTLEVYRK